MNIPATPFLKRALVAGFCLTAGLAAGLAPAQAQVKKQVKPIASGFLNVRSGPGTSYADIGDLASGSVIDVLGYDPTDRWAIINWNGQIAYVARNFLTDPAPVPAAGAGLGWFEVTGIPANDADGGLVVRAGPGTKFARLTVVPNGTRLKIIALSPNRKWSQAQSPSGATGWVRNSYLRPTTAPAQSQPQPQPQPQPLPAGPTTSMITTPGWPTTVYEFPNDTAPSLTVLNPNSPVAVVEQLHQDWVKVLVDGQEGYLHSQGATPGGGATTTEGMQVGLSCAGTEPFWTYQINTDGTTVFEDVGSQGAPIASTMNQINGTSYPYTFQAGPITGQLNNQVCSDGMSDNLYPWELLLNVTLNGSQQTVQGCCTLQ